MKIYFNGCSWSYGDELENPTEERFSKLVCNHFGAEETNVAVNGGSNDRILRILLLETDISQYDLGIIQLSCPTRTEYFDKIWRNISVPKQYTTPLFIDDKVDAALDRHTKSKEVKGAVKNYYKYLMSPDLARTKEEVANKTVRLYFKDNNVPLILVSISGVKTNLDYDIQFMTKKYPLAPRYHPTKEGHRMIADELINIIKSRKIF
jgi:hypothetical protein